ncbi:hypothetical protein ACGF5O_23440 [Streptomyces sp. NPDC048291]|uniref:hypothetical protein n=1 Tax=Streptomyces sp. NPDC048291 TaxID=3365530 RepID=UPI00371430E5
MASEQRGRTAPWAKTLGAVLLALLTVTVTYYAVGAHRADQRKAAALKGTREDAQRFVDDVLARDGGFPTTRRQMDEVYATAVGRTGAWLYYLRFDGAGARVLARFSRSYEPFPHLFGSGDTKVSRCFTIDFPSRTADPTQVRITAHEPDESCEDVAADKPESNGA